MKDLLLTAFAFILLFAPAAAQKNITIPMEASAWETYGRGAEFTTHLGQKSLYITGDNATATGSNIISVKGQTFANGTIEYDIAFTEQTRFTSIHFRRANEKNSEHFYLRGFWAKDPNINTAIQYSAILNGVNIWDLSGDFQSKANLKPKEWNHVKLVVKDGQFLAYVNDMNTPALYVPQMDGDWASGRIGFDGTAYLANLKISPDATAGLAGKGHDFSAHDSRYLRNWQVSQPTAFPLGREVVAEDLPQENTAWSDIKAERLGTVNLSRKFGATPRGERRLVWLKTTITASKEQVRKLDFGFSDEVWIYLNGQPFHVDKNIYNTPQMKTPRGRCSLENSSLQLPLKEGKNEVLIGVSNFFFGWGIVARLDDVEGLEY